MRVILYMLVALGAVELVIFAASFVMPSTLAAVLGGVVGFLAGRIAVMLAHDHRDRAQDRAYAKANGQ